MLKFFFLSIIFLLLNACSTCIRDGKPRDFYNFDVRKIRDAIPKNEAKSKLGNPTSYKVNGRYYKVLKSALNYRERGIASWYGTKFHKQKTSSGEPYDMYQMTAAHKTLPLPTYARVTNLSTGVSIIVRINDRGPFKSNRIIDLSFVAAKKLNITQTGTAYVEVAAIDPRHFFQRGTFNRPAYPLVHKPQVYLQLGAFYSRFGAQHYSYRIKQITSRTIHIVMEKHKQAWIYKLQIGPLSGIDELDRLAASFKKSGMGDAFAVVH